MQAFVHPLRNYSPSNTAFSSCMYRKCLRKFRPSSTVSPVAAPRSLALLTDGPCRPNAFYQPSDERNSRFLFSSLVVVFLPVQYFYFFSPCPQFGCNASPIPTVSTRRSRLKGFPRLFIFLSRSQVHIIFPAGVNYWCNFSPLFLLSLCLMSPKLFVSLIYPFTRHMSTYWNITSSV